ncbi:hypothetical protein D6D04_05813 [Aureobasidium pullulans]|nr:hypothetical protein D6D04_05813 [Aureobasidium pullulans]
MTEAVANGTPAKKQLILNAFVESCSGHQSPGLWRHPDDKSTEFNKIQHWVKLAQLLEKGKFHGIFIADVLGAYDVYKGPKNPDPAIISGAQWPVNEPLATVPAMAAATENIGFVVTVATTYEQPYHLARRLSTVDHLSGGRVGWNVVTGYLDSAARNLGRTEQPEHDDRYAMAEEYIEVLYKLWQSSWRDDAVKLDREKIIYTDPALVRTIDHVGKYYNVPGPHICQPSPQRTPVILQAGTSKAGKEFGAKNAEAIFVAGHSPSVVAKNIAEIRALAKDKFGRDPKSIKFLTLLCPIIGKTQEEAEAKYKEYLSYGSEDGASALFGGWTGIDLDKYGDDEELRHVQSNAVRSAVEGWSKATPNVAKWTKHTVANHIKVGGLGATVIGTAEHVADELERWVREADVVESLKVKAADDYIEGNYMGSLLTMKSKRAVLFGLVLKFGNLALVLMDTAFWQKSFASEVESVVPAYDLVSVVILAVPWCTGTIIGLTGRAIEKTPIWWDYPNLLTETQVNSGLVMPYVLRSLLGQGATTGLLVLIFMAITSTVSSSVIAVSSIISLDFYRAYINPKASDRKVLQVSHIGVVGHGCFMAAFAIMLQYAGATNNWSTYFRPIVACPGIFPLILTLLWSRQTKAAAILSPILGLASGVATWLSLSYVWGGKIDIQTTQEQLPGLYGAIVSFFSPALFSVVISLARPSQFDWREFLRIDLIEDSSQPSTSLASPQDSKDDITKISPAHSSPANEKHQPTIDAEAKAGLVSPATSISTRTGSLDDIVHPFSDQTIRHIKKWRNYAAGYFVLNLLVTVVLWPVPMYRDYIFSLSFFKGWVTVAIIWHFAAMLAVIVYPVWDGRFVIGTVFKGVQKEWSRKG